MLNWTAIPDSFGRDLCALADGLDKIDLNRLSYIAWYLRDFGIDMISLLSKEERDLLEKRGCIFLTPFEDGMMRIYSAKDVKWYYEVFHYDKESLRDAMRLDGATDEEIEEEFKKLDIFLRTDRDADLDDLDPEISDEQYKKAVAYLKAEEFVESLQQETSMSLTEKYDAITNLVDFNLSNHESENVSDKVLSIVDDAKKAFIA